MTNLEAGLAGSSSMLKKDGTQLLTAATGHSSQPATLFYVSLPLTFLASYDENTFRFKTGFPTKDASLQDGSHSKYKGTVVPPSPPMAVAYRKRREHSAWRQGKEGPLLAAFRSLLYVFWSALCFDVT
jgi:hypothetical protein